MVKPKPIHHKRTRILEEGLLAYIDQVKITDRNKDIVTMYTGGASYKSISEKYGISTTRVSSIVTGYILSVLRVK